MKNLIMGLLALTFLFSMESVAGFQGYQSTTNLGLFSAVKCSTGLSCSKVGEKIQLTTTSAGTLQPTIAATAVSISASQCGSTFRSTGTVQMGLPTATSALIGCRLTFITGVASNFQINPDDGDQILILTNSAGDRVSNFTAGNTLTLQAAAVSQWVDVAEKGTWADSN